MYNRVAELGSFLQCVLIAIGVISIVAVLEASLTMIGVLAKIVFLKTLPFMLIVTLVVVVIYLVITRLL